MSPPLTPEQAKQIDWSTLIRRLLDLRSPLHEIRDTIAQGDEPTISVELTTLDDVLATLDAIEELTKQPEEEPPDATA